MRVSLSRMCVCYWLVGHTSTEQKCHAAGSFVTSVAALSARKDVLRVPSVHMFAFVPKTVQENSALSMYERQSHQDEW